MERYKYVNGQCECQAQGYSITLHYSFPFQKVLRCLRNRGINPRIARLLRPYIEPKVHGLNVSYVSMPMGSWGGKRGSSYLSMWKTLMDASLPFYISRTGQSKEEYGRLVKASLEDVNVTHSFCNIWVYSGQKW